MNKNNNTVGALMLILTALIWGTAFVAQSVGMDYVGPYTFNCVRFLIGGVILIPCIFLLRYLTRDTYGLRSKEEKKERRFYGIKGGICCGILLCISSLFQQFGIMHTTVGKAGFITSLYIILVPFIALLTGKKLSWKSILGAIIALMGMYLLCIKEGVSVNKGDILILICAVGFSFHIMVVDHYSKKADGVFLSCIQFLTAGVISGVGMLICESPHIVDIFAAWKPILYAGIMSCGVAYTLQVLGQRSVKPAIASLIMSLESVFSALAGWVLLNQVLNLKEIAGCALMFIAIIIAQMPDAKAKKVQSNS